MIVQHQPPLHLTYCLNVHPGIAWEDNFQAIREKSTAIHAAVAPQDWFGLGLRVGAHGWRTQECVGDEWDGIRSDDEAREQAEKFIERDIR